MKNLSKPQLVNLLRYLDKNKLLIPRIKYASFRSKVEMMVDLRKHFYLREVDHKVYFVPKRGKGLPEIFWDCKKKEFSVDVSLNNEVGFSVSRTPVTVRFESSRE